MLTNLTWLRKCAKEMGDEAGAAEFTAERAQLKSSAKAKGGKGSLDGQPSSDPLQKVAIQCRLYARQLALGKNGGTSLDRNVVLGQLALLGREISRAKPSSMTVAAQEFYDVVNVCLRNESGDVPRTTILNACDALR